MSQPTSYCSKLTCHQKGTREILKDHNLSFTEMAKAVGHRWQALPADEREAFEQHAVSAKEHYIAQMTEYRKTEQWAQYNEYFNEFKRTVGANQQGAPLAFARPSNFVPRSTD